MKKRIILISLFFITGSFVSAEISDTAKNVSVPSKQAQQKVQSKSQINPQSKVSSVPKEAVKATKPSTQQVKAKVIKSTLNEPKVSTVNPVTSKPKSSQSSKPTASSTSRPKVQTQTASSVKTTSVNVVKKNSSGAVVLKPPTKTTFNSSSANAVGNKSVQSNLTSVNSVVLKAKSTSSTVRVQKASSVKPIVTTQKSNQPVKAQPPQPLIKPIPITQIKSIQSLSQPTTAVSQPTVAQPVDFTLCVKNYTLHCEKLFYLTLASVNANRFKIDEFQSKSGYILFTAAKRQYLATIIRVDSQSSILKITPADNIYFFPVGVVQNIFKYIELNFATPIEKLPVM